MAKCSICGALLANAPDWLDDVPVFTCPDCKSAEGDSLSVTPVAKSDKKEGCPTCGGTNFVANDENSLRCDDCGTELCKLCESELIAMDGGRECKGCGAIYPDADDEESSDDSSMESEDFDN
jgi:ribosomal protein S27AE